MFTEKQIKKLNLNSDVQLSKQETQIAQDIFQNAIKKVFDAVVKLYKPRSNETKFSRNRIIVRLAEMFEDEVETNY